MSKRLMCSSAAGVTAKGVPPPSLSPLRYRQSALFFSTKKCLTEPAFDSCRSNGQISLDPGAAAHLATLKEGAKADSTRLQSS